MHIYIHSYIKTYIHTYSTHTYVLTYTYIHTTLHTHTCIHTYIHTHAPYIHTYTYKDDLRIMRYRCRLLHVSGISNMTTYNIQWRRRVIAKSTGYIYTYQLILLRYVETRMFPNFLREI